MQDDGMTRKRKATALYATLFTGLVMCGCSREAPPSADASAPPGGETAMPDKAPRVDFATFHASGELPCTISTGEPIGPCAFGVRREGGGNAIVTVMPTGARTRTIYFQNGEPAGHGMSEADAAPFEGHREGRLFVVTIGAERYEIPDTVVFGE
jgi:hypothetical protein